MKMTLDPAQYQELVESKAALARHGVVIIRSVEYDLEPAIMSAAKNSIYSSPAILNEMADEELDEFMEDLRKVAMKSASELRELYIRLIAQLGTEYLGDLVKELDGIEKLFTWDRISKSVEPVNKKLKKMGFEPVRLHSAEDVSEALALQLDGKWPEEFKEFKRLAGEAAKRLGDEDAKRARSTRKKGPSGKKPAKKKTGTAPRKKKGTGKKE